MKIHPIDHPLYTLEDLPDRVEKKPYLPPEELLMGDDKIWIGNYIKTIPEEVWVPHPFLDYQCSNYGRIASKDLSLIFPQFPMKDTEDYFLIRGVDGYYEFVYTLIAEAFLLKDNTRPWDSTIIHHITNNGWDNRHTNLVYTDLFQHAYSHNRLPEGWEDMEEEEVQKPLKKSLSAWWVMIKKSYNFRDWRERSDMKDDYLYSLGRKRPF